ncbi:hypothetical protein GCM10011376_03800 [Nocardioides flavus (ex Wang et al. 2016)]|uniref:Uncharacterized protein n=1 Tax=Nocardioides flavus (ex Wang et al. 2016) TaxID=2058780 RepID=A0ABQ3HDW9_9ACTN|nr:hypothetical protein [Nocardioides flavus (ex Wang et al. 2016)]GHE15479.1 hypothetical protein GCM10011376_03800 [Nocardioides flavus (ex Wang et al. 2016)]
MTVRVVLVRPWTDAHGGTGCCGGEARDGLCFDGRVDGPRAHDQEVGTVAEAHLRLLAEVPEADVQIVGADNTAYLLPSVFRAVRRRRGTWAALKEANRATTAGSLLVDGERVGDVQQMGAEAVVTEVRRRVSPAGVRTGRSRSPRASRTP